MKSSLKGPGERLVPVEAAVQRDGEDAGVVYEQAERRTLQSKARHVLPRRFADGSAEYPMQMRRRVPRVSCERGQVEIVFEVRLDVNEQRQQLDELSGRSLGRFIAPTHAQAIAPPPARCAWAPPR